MNCARSNIQVIIKKTLELITKITPPPKKKPKHKKKPHQKSPCANCLRLNITVLNNDPIFKSCFTESDKQMFVYAGKHVDSGLKEGTQCNTHS